MRVEALKISLFAVLAMLAPAASAHPRQGAARVAAESASTSRGRAHAPNRSPAALQARRILPLRADSRARLHPVRGRRQRGLRVPPIQPVSLGVTPRHATLIPKVEPVTLPTLQAPELYSRRGRLLLPPAMKGSHEILLHQNEMADLDGLARVRDDVDLQLLRDTGMLVALPTPAGMQTDQRLPLNRRFCRPWTAQFLNALAQDHRARFHNRLQVNSAVRTVEFQQHLLRTNGNAAPAEGDTASPHLTGQAIDLAKHGLSLAEIAWLRGYLQPLVQEGKIDVEEEFQQACFHISVYRKYMPTPAGRHAIAEDHRASATNLAAAIMR